MTESTILTGAEGASPSPKTALTMDVSSDASATKGKTPHTVMGGLGVAENKSAPLTKNQQLAESGEFDQLLSLVDSNLVELGEQEDSKEMVEALTEIANAGNPEYRVWACKMLNWHNDMAKFMRGLQE